jgi:hypothetical protein
MGSRCHHRWQRRAIIAWNDNRNNVAGNDDDVYAQRVDSTGIVQWLANGVAIATTNGYQGSLRLTSAGNGGAIIAWQDTRNGTIDVFAQKVDGAGGMQWIPNGVAVASASGGVDRYVQLIAEAGGAILCWQDRRNGTDLNIYAQKLNSNGVEQWTANGVTACSAANNQQYPQLAADGSGGAILTWQDNRAGAGPADVYAQRINSAGSTMWITSGEAICALTGAQSLPQIASDGSGGAVIAWMDGRSPTTPNDIYAQRIAADGTALWTTNGVGVSTAPQNQGRPLIINDGSNGTIVSWEDNRYDVTRNDIFAQRLNPDGTLGRVNPVVLSAPLRPDSSRFQFTISGTAGQSYVIQASGDLTNWLAIATNIAPSDTFNYTNSAATNLLQYYRVKQGL